MWWQTFWFWAGEGMFGYMWWQTFWFWAGEGMFGYMWWQTFRVCAAAKGKGGLLAD